VQELALATERWVGPATILVNNAGVIDPVAPLTRSDPALWLRNVGVNIGGTYMPTRAVLPGMLERAFGRIVNISSGSATRPSAALTAYSAAKAGVVQLTRSLGLELEGTGVTAVAYNPGSMDTEMQERLRRYSTADFRSPRTTGRWRAREDSSTRAPPRASSRTWSCPPRGETARR
jgi:NAD(P)-dependent dehydrogenase (short-subunit alcohol dehydrogenase family)